jgi:hypothetical protein
MPGNYSIEVIGLEDVMRRISMLPKETQKNIVSDVGKYSVKVLEKAQAKYRYVSRAEAYGRQAGGMGWFSDAQRKFVMMQIRSGAIKIPYRRTGKLAHSWNVQFNPGAGLATITSTASHAPFVQGMLQSRHEAKVGWKRVVDIIAGELSFRSSKFRTVVMAAYQRAIRKLNLG